MVEIRWSPLATDDFESVIKYYEKTAPKFAQNFAKKIIIIIENLHKFPKMGKIVLELEDTGIREIIYRNFRIIYRLKEDFLEIARIIHGSRILRI